MKTTSSRNIKLRKNIETKVKQSKNLQAHGKFEKLLNVT